MLTALLAPLGALILGTTIGPIAQATTPSPHPSPTGAPLPVVAPMFSCTTPAPFAMIAIDPLAPINVNTTQRFVVALRAVEDAGYAWRLIDAPKPTTVVRSEGMQSIWDTAFQNLGQTPGASPIVVVGGAATELFLFTAAAPGSAVLAFGEFAPGTAAPLKSVSFTVRVSPMVVIC